MRNEPVYRKRRAVALVIVVVLLALVVWAITAIVSALRSDSAPSGATSGSTSPDPQQSVEAVACEAGQLAVALTAPQSTYAAGTAVPFGVSVSAAGDVTCGLDVGNTALVVTVTSGSDRIWASSDCVTAQAAEVVLSEGMLHNQVVEWPSVRSDPEQCGTDFAALRPGTYRATAAVLGVTSAELVLTLTQPDETVS